MSEFEELVNRWLDGEIEEAEIARLNECLAEGEDRAHYFAERVSLNYLLREEYLAEADYASSERLSRESRFLEDSLPVAGSSAPSARHPSLRLLAGLLTAGVAVLALVTVIMRPAGRVPVVVRDASADDESRGAVETPGASEQPEGIFVESAPPGAAYPSGSQIAIGQRVQFPGGDIHLRFPAGASVVLTGPADLEIISPLRARLFQGQLTATVAEQARGFTIATEHADIIDLGTRFGVNVGQSGEADVVVFEGRVEIDYTRDGRDRKLESVTLDRLGLSVGEAVRINGSESYFRIPVIRQGATFSEWSTVINETNSSIIARLSDNFPKTDRPIYYSIVPGGFDEDASAYLDRPHEWNSLPGKPFPEALRGQDYVRLRNDLKYVLNLKLALELRRPARVYILFDDRVPTPPWLQNNFTKTDLEIGADESPPRNQQEQWVARTTEPLGKGPGMSVDARYHVWARDCSDREPVILGSLIDAADPAYASPQLLTPLQITGLSMYGIVVVPLAIRPAPP